ncbi:unnamed protein product [Amoebophrya sp. A120]|nr:unnamed protein product [Amoebophrya sp. A120]|eukprot:GSA120T00014450001.1
MLNKREAEAHGENKLYPGQDTSTTRGGSNHNLEQAG